MVWLLVAAWAVQLLARDRRLHASLLVVAGALSLGQWLAGSRRALRMAIPVGRDDSEVAPPSRPPRLVGARRQALLAAATAAGAILGTFRRYSWPVALPVALLALAAVLWAWRAPRSPAQGPLPGGSGAWWGLLAAALAGWELAAFALQPSIALSTPAHPTLSGLLAPVLAQHWGRSLWLAAWLWVGGYLVSRR